MNIRCRGYQDGDLDSMQSLMLELGYAIDRCQLAWNVQEIIRRGGIIIVAEGEGEVIGSVCTILDVRLAEGRYAEIVSLVVSGGHRRKGIGKALIEEAERWATTHAGKIRVRANTIRMPAHSFYESLGYLEIKEQKVFTKTVQPADCPADRPRP